MSNVFTSDEVKLALGRYRSVTGLSRDDFIHWLGLLLFLTYVQDTLAFGIVKNRSYTMRKMDMLLSPHWFALLKADLARNERPMEVV